MNIQQVIWLLLISVTFNVLTLAMPDSEEEGSGYEDTENYEQWKEFPRSQNAQLVYQEQYICVYTTNFGDVTFHVPDDYECAPEFWY